MAQSFGEGFASGVNIGNMFRQRQFEQSIDDAGAQVQAEMQREKDLKAEQARAQEQLLANSKPTRDQVTPSTFQQGDSLGLQGYQVGNKPIQTTVPTAPPGYMSRGDNMSENDLSPGGLEYPSANPATEQTLLGNYGTTAAFKGEKPTAEDTRMMQKDLQRPFNGPQDNAILDLAQVKPEVTPQEEAKPKPLDTLNEQITVADKAREAYDYNMRVVRKLQQSGNARAALEYQGKVASTELTLAQADHSKFTTVAAMTKLGGDTANNALESMQQPGADVNKIYSDWANNLTENIGYKGRVPFSLDPRENMKTVEQFAKNALLTSEKADLGIKQSAAAQKAIFDTAEFAFKQEKLTLDKIATGLAINKDNREQFTSSFTRTVELVKLQNKYINDINSTISEKDREALKPVYEDNLKLLEKTAKALNVPMPNIAVATPGSVLSTISTQPRTANVQPGAAPTAVNAPANVQPVNTRFSDDSLAAVGAKPLTDTAGGYPRPESVVKTPAQIKTDQTANKKASSQIEQNNNTIKTLAERLTSKKSLATTAAQRQIITDQEVSKIVKAQYDKDWNKTKAFWGKVAGVDNQAILDQIEELKKQNKELETK